MAARCVRSGFQALGHHPLSSRPECYRQRMLDRSSRKHTRAAMVRERQATGNVRHVCLAKSVSGIKGLFGSKGRRYGVRESKRADAFDIHYGDILATGGILQAQVLRLPSSLSNRVSCLTGRNIFVSNLCPLLKFAGDMLAIKLASLYLICSKEIEP